MIKLQVNSETLTTLELAQSPCIHRGWKEISWCRDCTGFSRDCKDRRPEALYKDKKRTQALFRVNDVLSPKE